MNKRDRINLSMEAKPRAIARWTGINALEKGVVE
jgi:hypothetical protein